MKLSNIKTKSEFYDFADIWYQRTINLARIWNDNEETARKRSKAFSLWYIMFQRMSVIMQAAMHISKPKRRENSSGGGIVGEHHREEIVKLPSGFKTNKENK